MPIVLSVRHGVVMSGRTAKRLRAEQKATVESPKRRIPRLAAAVLPFAFGAVVATAVTLLIVSKNGGANAPAGAATGIRYSEPPPGRSIDPSLIDTEMMMVRKWRKVDSLDELLKLTPEELEKVDIAEMNLLCSTGLPGAEDLNISKILMSLDAWAASARYQTNRHLSRIAAREYAKANRGATTQPVTARRPQYRPRDPMEELRRIEAINAYNRRLMEQHMRPPTPPSPYGPQVPQPGVPNPHQPYQPPVPGQPRR